MFIQGQSVCFGRILKSFTTPGKGSNSGKRKAGLVEWEKVSVVIKESCGEWEARLQVVSSFPLRDRRESNLKR